MVSRLVKMSFTREDWVRVTVYDTGFLAFVIDVNSHMVH